MLKKCKQCKKWLPWSLGQQSEYKQGIGTNCFRPDTQSYIEKLKRDEMEKAKGGKADDRSFFAKYVSLTWITIN